MAQSMKDIKRRINSIGSIMQITNAMELVSSAKLRKARQKLDQTRPYYQTVFENINEIISLSRDNKSPLLEKREVKRRAVVVIASDRGLAGGYNINVAKRAFNLIKDDHEIENVIYTTGKRSVEVLKKSKHKVNTDFTFIGEDPDSEEAAQLGSFLVSQYQSKKIDEVIIVYTKFNSVLSLEPNIIKLLPAEGFEEKEIKTYTPIEFEPSASAVLTQMIKQYVNVTIYGCLLESAASEQASRRTAMENATSNGEELLEDLELMYNRARQASITQEISEIVGGAEALK